jgi:hypothetical protein
MERGNGRKRLDLNGAWELAFDPDERTARDAWIQGSWPNSVSKHVTVPSVWNVVQPDAPCVGYYRRSVRIPADWASGVVRLHVAGACYRLDAWVNGEFLGSHEGAYTPFWFNASAVLRYGDTNDIVFRATSLSLQRRVDGMVLKEMPVAKQSWHYAEGGIWGSVWMETVAPVYCDAIAVEPDLRRTRVAIDVSVTNTLPEAVRHVLRVCVIDPHGTVVYEHSEEIFPPFGTSRYFTLVPVDSPYAWSCENPNLYQCRIEIVRDELVIDGNSTAFGLRDFTVKDGQFFLNGEPIFVRGILLQPNYPVGISAPLDDSMLETEVRLAKEAGFNMIRVHLRPAAPGFLELTDREGMLVYAESSLAWIQESPRLLDHARREVAALIERDQNHPSVVIWGIFNEHRGPSARYSDALIRTARAIDATRVIIDNSGGSLAIDQDFGWIDRATAVPDRSMSREYFQDIHIYAGAPLAREAINLLAAIGSPHQTIDAARLGIGSQPIFDEWQRETRDYQGQIFVSEIGCGGMADLEEMVAGYGDRTDLLDAREYAAFRNSLNEGFAKRGLGTVFGSVKELVRQAQHQQAMGNRRQIEALMTNPRVSGYTVTQLNDLSCEFHAGILDIWRKPKAVFHETKRLQQSRVLILDLSKRAVSIGEKVEIAVVLVDEIHVGEGERVEITVFDSSGAERLSRHLEAPAGRGVKHLGRISVTAADSIGMWQIESRLSGNPRASVDEALLVLDVVDDIESAQPSDANVVTALAPSMLTEGQWRVFLDAVRSGKTGIVGDLAPGDDRATEAFALVGIDVQLQMGIGSWLGCYHWRVDSPVFEGLPSKGLSGEVFAEVLPHYVLSELGGKVLAGTLTNTQTRIEAARMLWYSDIELVPLGSGRLVFCQYRIFDDNLKDAVGHRLRRNLFRFASSRGAAIT